ncbi:MAG: hypothetical protein L3K14_00155 [Thermoplasmata archaeon]|nr:hypothetical protein [Thermoplasmata archaeon]
MPAVSSQGNSSVAFAGWSTTDSSLLVSTGDSQIEVTRFQGTVSPTGPAPSKAFIHIGTNAAHPNLKGVRLHDVFFDGGGLLDVSFMRVRLDVAAGRSGTDVVIDRIHCRNGSPQSVWADCVDSYGIDGCTITNVVAEGCYTGVSVANSHCTVSDCTATNCYSQGLQLGGPGQLGPISDILVTNFVARGCCRGIDPGQKIVNAQIFISAAHGTIQNLRLEGCVGDTEQVPTGVHGLTINGPGMGTVVLKGSRFVGNPVGKNILIAGTVPSGVVSIQ